MNLHDLKPGDAVIVVAKGDFFAFVDGWRGVVQGFNNGLVQVKCDRVDGVKTLYIPANELVLSV